MTTSTDTRVAGGSRRARRLTGGRPAMVGAIVGLTAAAVLAAPATAAPPPAPGAGTFTVVDVREQDFGNDGIIDQTTTTRETFDRLGRVQSSVVEDRQGDGTVSYVETTTWEYDRQGKTLGVTTETDYGADALLDIRHQVAFEYDRSGRLVRVVESSDEGADGVDVTTFVRDTAYSKRTLITDTTDVDWDGDGIADERTVETTHFDQRGNAVLLTKTVDREVDGSIEVEESVTRTFDKTTLISELYEAILPSAESSLTTYDYDRKGLLTGTTETFEPSGASIVMTFSFDADGVFTGSTRVVDHDGDGVVDEESIETVESDDEGRPLVQHVDTFGDGDPYRETTTYAYEGDDLVELTFTLDLLIDGDPELIEQQTTVYEEGRVVEFTSTADYNGDGTLDYLTRTTLVYDARGEVITSITETDYDADGVIDFTETQTRTIE